MDRVIHVTIRDKIAVADTTLYVCGNSDFTLDIDFDAEWDEFSTKTARFIYNGTFQDVVFQGSTCQVPIISNTYKIYVGVFAGNLRTTTPAYIGAKKSILCGTEVPAAPSDDVYNQIMELLNQDDGTSDLPAVTEEDNGKVLMVDGGVWTAKELPAYGGTYYEGSYEVTPSASEDVTLQTENTYLDANIVVQKIPYAEVTNAANGTTVTIAE